jgi:hypothetical protein
MIQYASFSVGRNRSTSPARSTKQRMNEAGELLATIPKHEHAAARAAGEAYCVRFVGPSAEPTLFRGTERVDSRWGSATSAEIRAARAKVRRVAEAGSRPYVDALAKIARYKAIAAAAWENG